MIENTSGSRVRNRDPIVIGRVISRGRYATHPWNRDRRMQAFLIAWFFNTADL